MFNFKINQNLLNIIFFVITLLLITIGLSFAYFTADISGEETGTTITVTGGTMNITYNGGASLNVSNFYPKAEAVATKTFTVIGNNTTALDMYYNISLVVTSNTFSSGALKYKLISTNTDGNGTIIPSKTTMQYIGSGASNIIIGNGSFKGPTDGNKVHTYSLEIYFPDTDVNQNDDQGKSFNAYIKIESGHVLLPFNEEKGVNRPVLATGMTPVVYNTDTLNWDNTTENDPNWYDYNIKKWANAITEDGSFWVWIPRYAYKIQTCYHLSANECETLTGLKAGVIDIKFLKDKSNDTVDSTQIETSGYQVGVKDTSMYYFLHPAFVFGKDEIPGIWVAKFEASNDGNNNVQSKPNSSSWRDIHLSTMFLNSQSMKNKKVIYGWNLNEVDPHMMKNIEWGAVTYLSKSKYGANTEEIWNNSYNGYMTGCSGTGVDAANESTCITYETINGQKASTTHNIYGIYDMSGGTWEYVMGNYDNISYLSGFTEEEVQNMDSKYIDRYKGVENFDLTKYGDAMYETSNNISGVACWYRDSAYLSLSPHSWLIRGDYWNTGYGAGPFNYLTRNGFPNISNGFRVSLVVLS